MVSRGKKYFNNRLNPATVSHFLKKPCIEPYVTIRLRDAAGRSPNIPGVRKYRGRLHPIGNPLSPLYQGPAATPHPEYRRGHGRRARRDHRETAPVPSSRRPAIRRRRRPCLENQERRPLRCFTLRRAPSGTAAFEDHASAKAIVDLVSAAPAAIPVPLQAPPSRSRRSRRLRKENSEGPLRQPSHQS